MIASHRRQQLSLYLKISENKPCRTKDFGLVLSLKSVSLQKTRIENLLATCLNP